MRELVAPEKFVDFRRLHRQPQEVPTAQGRQGAAAIGQRMEGDDLVAVPLGREAIDGTARAARVTEDLWRGCSSKWRGYKKKRKNQPSQFRSISIFFLPWPEFVFLSLLEGWHVSYLWVHLGEHKANPRTHFGKRRHMACGLPDRATFQANLQKWPIWSPKKVDRNLCINCSCHLWAEDLWLQTSNCPNSLGVT